MTDEETVPLVAVVQLRSSPVGVAPQLSARVTGEEYDLLVRPSTRSTPSAAPT